MSVRNRWGQPMTLTNRPQPSRRLAMGAIALLTLAALSGSPSTLVAQNATSAPEVVAFVDVTVVPMDSERLVPHQTVIVRRDRIEMMGSSSSTTVATNALRIDGSGKYLMPGFFDMHAHVPRLMSVGA